MTSTTRRIMDRLAKLGVPSTFGGDIDEQTDGEIKITPTVALQVGADYLIVNVWDSADEPTAMRHYPTRSHRQLDDVIQDIAMAKIYDFDAKPAFIRSDAVWHIAVYPVAGGGCIIERLCCPARLRPSIWTNAASPEEWVGMQRDSSTYVPQAGTPAPATPPEEAHA
jgi:hypothetical protein